MLNRRWAGSAVLLAVVAALVGCGSDSSAVTPMADRVATTVTTASTLPTASSEVTEFPEDWEVRVTDGVERDETLRLLDEAVAVLGPERSGYWDNGDGFEVRVVEPTSQDDAVVAQSQAGTSIPLTVVAVPMSDSWLEQTMHRLDEDLSNPAVSVGVDLEAGRLYVAIDRRNAPNLQDDVFTEQVRELMELYLSDGRQEGAVAEGVTADQAIDIVDGHFD